MDAISNPYQPGAGLRPPELAGREVELQDFDTLLGRAEAHRQSQSIVLTGLRGVGKTVLLNEFANRARRRGWIVVQLEARREDETGNTLFRGRLAQALNTSLREVTGSWGIGERFRDALGVFRSFSLSAGPFASIGIEVEPRSGVADSGDLSIDLAELARHLALAADERDVGVVVLIDEMQDVDLADLGALCGANHEAGQRGLPFYVAGAGLPSLPGRLSEARSYAERLFTYRVAGPLTNAAASDAVVLPASHEHVMWDDTAVEVVIRSSKGYPYFIQEFAKAAWNRASDARITLDDAEYGVRTGLQLLDAGFFQSRWTRATPAERSYLSAMALDRGLPSSSTEIATRIGKKPTSVGPMRANLIYKGLVFAPEHGLIAFTVPGMAEFIERQAD